MYYVFGLFEMGKNKHWVLLVNAMDPFDIDEYPDLPDKEAYKKELITGVYRGQ